MRELMKDRPGKRYTEVSAGPVSWLDGREETSLEAVAVMTDPANQAMCERCGWTHGMVCPECSGCGYENGRCTGWRHREDPSYQEALDDEDDFLPL
ncbi:hypothetical protein [Nonomuraea aridisoli]|uniref:Uncharacterized protein n=1 Tax=Nonomuraea aridisoli TaxID=2070368 RepID=A0A2W2F4H6_9ACTN|nr:hypothetical protein [Nonomuraea aridisoli]PZG19928.1 hypothetical protein C1J01_10835 [Nonomuraea aridisoli]